jgi:hypothetical protein
MAVVASAVRELQRGLWHWEARHPDWTPEQGWTPEQSGSTGWGPEVSSYAIDDGEQLLLFDPLAVPSEIEELAASRQTTIVLTCPWHQRDAPIVAERLGVPIYLLLELRVELVLPTLGAPTDRAALESALSGPR